MSNKFDRLSVVFRFILCLMRSTDLHPGCLEERVLYEVFANLHHGIFGLSPEAIDLLSRYHSGAEGQFRRLMDEPLVQDRLLPFLLAREAHGCWTGLGHEIDGSAIDEQWSDHCDEEDWQEIYWEEYLENLRWNPVVDRSAKLRFQSDR